LPRLQSFWPFWPLSEREQQTMEQSIRDWIIEARANGRRTDQPDDLAARWFDVADDLLALLKTISPDETKG
jgi:hypothetical protein